MTEGRVMTKPPFSPGDNRLRLPCAGLRPFSRHRAQSGRRPAPILGDLPSGGDMHRNGGNSEARRLPLFVIIAAASLTSWRKWSETSWPEPRTTNDPGWPNRRIPFLLTLLRLPIPIATQELRPPAKWAFFCWSNAPFAVWFDPPSVFFTREPDALACLLLVFPASGNDAALAEVS